MHILEHQTLCVGDTDFTSRLGNQANDFWVFQVFKDHAIDGETLPLLTEQHLRGTMGLKLGPVLKIQSQVWRRHAV